MKKTVEVWRTEQKTPLWLFRAAKVKFHWPQGRELTLADYQASLAATLNHRIA